MVSKEEIVNLIVAQVLMILVAKQAYISLCMILLWSIGQSFLKWWFGDSACLDYNEALAVLIYRQLFILPNHAFSSCGNQFSFQQRGVDEETLGCPLGELGCRLRAAGCRQRRTGV